MSSAACENGTNGEPSVTRAELRAVAAGLRFGASYLRNTLWQSAEDCDLDPEGPTSSPGNVATRTPKPANFPRSYASVGV